MAFPTTSVLDNFNRANATPPSSNWSLGLDSDISIVSNVAVCSFASSPSGDYWNVSTFGADTEVYATIPTRGSAGDYASMTLDVRITDAGTANVDAYEMEVVMREGGANVNIIRFWKIVNGSASQLGSDISTTVNSGDAFGFEVTGTSTTSLKAFRKPSGGSWGQVGSTYNDSSSPLTSAGYIGLGGYNNSASTFSMDDFGGGTVVSGGATLSISKSESITVSESVAATVGAPQVSKNESITISENVSVQIVTGDLTASKSESITVSESVVTTVGAPQVSKSESITVSEGVSVEIQPTMTYSVSVTDDVFVTEPGFVGYTSLVVSKGESITVSESVSVSLQNALGITVSDAVIVSEAISLAMMSYIGNAESVTVSESVSIASQALAIDTDEMATVTEGAVSSLPNALAVTVMDGVTIGESISLNVLISGTLIVNVSDNAVVTDSPNVSMTDLMVGMVESITVSESASALFGCQVFVAESVTATESVAVVTSMPQVQADETVTLTETVNVTLFVPGVYSVHVTETVTISDATLISVLSVDGSIRLGLAALSNSAFDATVLNNFAYESAEVDDEPL